MWEEDATSGGKSFRRCMEREDDLAGAKSSLLKMLGLKGKIPVAAKAECRSLGVMDLEHTDMYSSMMLYLSI
jgi:hypothetical protein